MPDADRPRDTALHAALFADPEIAALHGEEATLGSILAFEAALARALGALGAVDRPAVDVALAAIDAYRPDPASLQAATSRDGLAVPHIVRELRAAAGDGASAIHPGATSQDALDTALAIALRETSDALDARLAALIDDLDALHARVGSRPLTGVTRMQPALPIEAGDRVAAWTAPLRRHRARLAALRPRVERVSLTGPVGRGLGSADDARVAALVAAELGLGAPPSRHTERDGVIEWGQWCALLAGSLGRIGRDVGLMALTGSVRLAGGGGSSVMPHKSNPIDAELLEAQARHLAGLAGTLHLAALHEAERSGTAWAVEWLTLPALAEGCGAMLARARRLAAAIERMGE